MMVWLTQIELRNPWWLLLALQPILLWVLAMLRQRLHVDEFADADLLPWVISQRKMSGRYPLMRQIALLLAWCTMAIAVAGPRIQQRVIGGDYKNALVLQVVVDLSYSMSARDVTPTRLQRVKLELQDLIQRLQQTRMGLIVYAAQAHVMIPPTRDKTVLRQAVESLRVRELPTEGSDLFKALDLARQQLAHKTKQPQAILLVSDGEVSDDSARGLARLQNLVTSFRADSIHLYTLGVGTAQGTALLDDQNGWLQQNGRTVVTRLHAARLQQLAQLDNGRFAEVANDDSEWQTLYDSGISQLRPSDIANESNQLVVWRDLSSWFVLPGMLLLLLAYVRLPVMKQVSATALLFMLTATTTLHPGQSQAAEQSYPDAFSLYQNGSYQQAAKQFARLSGYRARMGEGASLYHLKQYPKAATVYIQAALDANTDTQRAEALFNLGNCYFKHADYVRAANTYRDVLRYQPEMKIASTNLTFAEALLKKSKQIPGAMTRRAGTGARMAPAAENTEVGKGRVSLDDSEGTSKHPLPAGNTTQSSNATSLGGQAKAITDKIELDKDVTWTYDITSARDISPQEKRIDVDQSVFWQHLFETEEGYPAPRKRPEILPGVSPW